MKLLRVLLQNCSGVGSNHHHRCAVLKLGKSWRGLVSLKYVNRFGYKTSQPEEIMFDELAADFCRKGNQ